MSWKRIGLRGVTMVELLIVVALIGIVASLGATMMSHVTRNVQLHNAKLDIQREASSALDIVNRTLRQASAASVEITQNPGQPPYSKISFTSIDGASWSFYQSGKSLYSVRNGNTSELTKNLRYIAFTYPDTGSTKIISVSVTLEKSTYEGQSKALQLSVEKVRIMND